MLKELGKIRLSQRSFWGVLMIINALIVKSHTAAYCFWLRMARNNNFVIRFFAKVMCRRLSRKYGLQILVSTQIGEGLYRSWNRNSYKWSNSDWKTCQYQSLSNHWK